ncbi:MAG TPA: hypothetical protein VGO47_11480 [Chlamydiales bacterium]|nr:hypothetical protein [Chlamydiales bacterium]
MAQSTAHSQTPEFENTQTIGTDNLYTRGRSIVNANTNDGDLSMEHEPMVFHPTEHAVGHVAEGPVTTDRTEEVLVESHVVEEVQEAVMEAHESMLDAIQEHRTKLYNDIASAVCLLFSLSTFA